MRVNILSSNVNTFLEYFAKPVGRQRGVSFPVMRQGKYEVSNKFFLSFQMEETKMILREKRIEKL